MKVIALEEAFSMEGLKMVPKDERLANPHRSANHGDLGDAAA
jgi:hypothetical protein